MQGIRLIIGLALLWLISGGFMGVALKAFWGLDWVGSCASLNLLLSRLLLAWITHNEERQKVLYDGAEKENEDELSLAALLVGFPVVLIVVAALWWLMAQFVA